ncbi:hypothetical protein QBC45DRAFT_479006 [Copromyces sp. CBS 386.78]|nr:hypothetical protein QBC45DRAFT_479006 [Copromyces sp. CBS 386.78]
MDLNLFTPGNAPSGYAHSASWLQQRVGQVIPTGTNGSTLQVLDLQNTGTATPLANNFHDLSVIVFEGTVEVILQDVPVFTLSRGGHWAVGVGKECKVRNPHKRSKAILYVVGRPV